jgi:nitrate reductase gamma subunit
MTLLVLAYLAILAFAGTIVIRALKIARMPVHLRWELYPVPHDANAAHGGSVLEHRDWWKVESAPKRSAALKVMTKEILLLDGVREHNPSLWLRSYPFHGGLYLLATSSGLLFASALLEQIGLASAAAGLASGTPIVGLAGFVLLGGGSAGLLIRRLLDPALRTHSAPADFFNLACFLCMAALGLATFVLIDRDFAHLRDFAKGLLTLTPVDLPGLVVVEIVAALALLVYLPRSHMSHFFTKWFMYHHVRWDDRVNRPGSPLEKKIQQQLGYTVGWAAPHVGGGHGGNTWVDVATSEVKK